jgi:hypothetical protein
MGAIASFNFQTWIKRYPEFSPVDADVVNLYWEEAQLYHKNDGSLPIELESTQTLLLNMLTAHIAQLNKHQPDGSTVSDLVGRISSGGEGSVSVSAAMTPSLQADWYNQTKYGAAYWRAMAGLRTMRYTPGPRRIFNPLYGGRPYW